MRAKQGFTQLSQLHRNRLKCYGRRKITSHWGVKCRSRAPGHSTCLKGNITFVCAHTANAAWFSPPSSSWHQMLRKNVNVALVDYLYQGFYALNTPYGTCVTWEFWFTDEISKRIWEKCITNRAEWTSSSVLHCNVTVAAWRRENTRDVGAAL